MYCSSCGAAVARGLSYRNHCGDKLSGAKGDGGAHPAELFPESLLWAIVSVFVVGLGIILGLMAVMKQVLNLNVGIILIATLLVFLLAVESVFIWLLLIRQRGAKEVRGRKRLKEHATKELDDVEARGLPEPVRSVSEHATRTFEPIYGERKSK